VTVGELHMQWSWKHTGPEKWKIALVNL